MKRPLIVLIASGAFMGAVVLSIVFYRLGTAALTGAAEQATENAEVADGPIRTRTLDLGDGIQIDFVWISPGSFIMGSSKWSPEEGPAHEVYITKGFWLAKCEVTNSQYRRFRPDHDSGMYQGRNLNGENQPVAMVSWDDAKAFGDWLTKEAEGEFRLPSEAEWEFACRAGSRSNFSFGESPARMREYAWYDQNSDGVAHPVGHKKPNAWGLHDMHGNVFEWCSDWFGEDYYARSPAQDPKGPETGQKRILRGGSWAHPASFCTASLRHRSEPKIAAELYGFRVVLVMTDGGL